MNTWIGLDHALDSKRFHTRWRSWMRRHFSSTSFAILVNGNDKGQFKATKGFRQGDSLSPFLFTTTVGILSSMLIRVGENGILEGFFIKTCSQPYKSCPLGPKKTLTTLKRVYKVKRSLYLYSTRNFPPI